LTWRRAALGAGQANISRTQSASFPTEVNEVLTWFVLWYTLAKGADYFSLLGSEGSPMAIVTEHTEETHPTPRRRGPVTDWIKDYGLVSVAVSILLALLAMGLPALYQLGQMTAQMKSLEDTIKDELRPDIKSIRDVLQAKDGVWMLISETRAKTDSVEKNVLDLNGRIQMMDTRTHDALGKINQQILDVWKTRTKQ
jgi:hypothetical protein